MWNEKWRVCKKSIGPDEPDNGLLIGFLGLSWGVLGCFLEVSLVFRKGFLFFRSPPYS